MIQDRLPTIHFQRLILSFFRVGKVIGSFGNQEILETGKSGGIPTNLKVELFVSRNMSIKANAGQFGEIQFLSV